jgi:hypothetical protein
MEQLHLGQVVVLAVIQDQLDLDTLDQLVPDTPVLQVMLDQLDLDTLDQLVPDTPVLQVMLDQLDLDTLVQLVMLDQLELWDILVVVDPVADLV